jgi:hypothetical protein
MSERQWTYNHVEQDHIHKAFAAALDCKGEVTAKGMITPVGEVDPPLPGPDDIAYVWRPRWDLELGAKYNKEFCAHILEMVKRDHCQPGSEFVRYRMQTVAAPLISFRLM